MTSLSYEELVALVDQLSVSQQDDLYHLLLARQAQRRPPTAEREQLATDALKMWVAICNGVGQPKDELHAPQG